MDVKSKQAKYQNRFCDGDIRQVHLFSHSWFSSLHRYKVASYVLLFWSVFRVKDEKSLKVYRHLVDDIDKK